MSSNRHGKNIWGAGSVLAPSMLKCDFGNLAAGLARLGDDDDLLIHWDVMDGHFVPNLSYGAMVIAAVRDVSAQPFEAHLMISDPGKYVDDYVRAGCDVITVHAEADGDVSTVLQRIREANVCAGLAINPGTPASAVEDVIDQCDQLLVMTVEPGFGGQSFMAEMLPKVRRLRDVAGSDMPISVDGGIGPQTIGLAAAAGADVFVVGSAIFDHSDYKAALAGLRETVQAG